MPIDSQAVHQIVGFHFKVFFLGVPFLKEIDVSFQSVSGLDVEIEKEVLKEGGENRFEHQLPGRTKYSPLILKRGILKPSDSGLSLWCQAAFHEMKIIPLPIVNVELLNEEHNVLMSWVLSHVWPVSWKIGELNAESGEVLIETLELNYNRLRLVAT